MTNTKNNLPLFEEQKQLITEEQKIAQIEKILSQFKQPIPSGFIPIEVEHIGSTKPNWENKPRSERYFSTHKEKDIQIDIPHTLLEKLGLKKGEDITQPLYLDPNVLTRSETYLGITIKEGEILLQQPFTIQNLEQNLNKLIDKIKKLEKERNKIQTDLNSLQDERNQLNDNLQTVQQERNRIQKNLTNLENELHRFQGSLLGSLFRSFKKSTKKITDLKARIVRLGAELFDKDQQMTDLRNAITNLNTQVNQLTIERSDYQNKWDSSTEELEQKEEIIRSYLRRVEELEEEKREIENENNTKQQELTQKDNQITRLENEVIKLRIERDARPNITPEHLNQLDAEINNLQAQRDNRPNITLSQWNNTSQKLIDLQQQLNNIQDELNNTKRERDGYYNRWSNHKCSSASWPQPSRSSTRYSETHDWSTGKTTF